MAPRTAKAKKTDVKVADTDATKKGRGKAKAVETPDLELETDDKPAPVVEKKTKRGKKADANGQEDIEASGAKKGKKKNVEEVEDNAEDEQYEEDAVAEENDENQEANGHTEPAPTGRGRKKAVKKEVEKPEPRAGRARKAKQEAEDIPEKEDKPKGKGRGRKAQPKQEEHESEPDSIEDEKPDPPAKGKKKGKAQGKEVEKDSEEAEEEIIEEPKKKETKGRKNLSKKAQAKEEVEEDEDDAKDEQPASKKRKGKKDDKAEQRDEDPLEDIPKEETKPKGRRGQKKVADVAPEAEEEPQDTGEPASKRRRKVPEEKAAEDKKKKLPVKNKTATDYDSLDFSNRSKNPQGKDWNFKIASWNVDGIRSWLGKGGLDYIKYEKPDILCLQETKCAKEKLPAEITNVPGYHAYWVESDKDGYAGVGIYTTQLAMNVTYGLGNEEFDDEGRVITAEYEQFYLICVYVPNSGRKLINLQKRLQWNDEFRNYIKELDEKKPVIICGDMNVSHREIDLTNPSTNRKNAGFSDEEREGMTQLLAEGFIDTFRQFYPDKTGAYTFWTYMMNSRAKNVGWRLDYFLVSNRLMPAICDSAIREQVYGSDHCPITLFLHLTSAAKPKE